MAIELGAGTGKFTRSLVRTEAKVIAVEPVAEMRAQLEADVPQAQAAQGSAQAIPAADASAHAVVCAQCFHWFATEEALSEICRVLLPTGSLALVWNVPDESVPWVAAVTDLLKAYDGDCPQQFRHGNWRRVFPDRRFTDLELTEFIHVHQGAPEQVILERARSLSYIANLEPAEHAAVMGRLSSLIATHPQLRGRPTVAFPYRTSAYHCTKL